jgi:hypothetical protein
MKFLITESKLQSLFDKYLSKDHPHLFNLIQDPLHKDDNRKIYGYQFLEPEDQIYMYFYYIMDDEHYDYTDDEKKSKGFPQLAPTTKLMSELKGMFGEKSYDLFKNWFEQTYKLPVNTVKRRDENFII